MKPSTLLLSIGLLITFVSARRTKLPIFEVNARRTKLPIVEGNDESEIRILVLVDNDDKLHFLDREPPVIKSVPVDAAEVTFHYKSRNTLQATEFYVFNIEDIIETDFDPRRRTMFIIHGWNNNKDSKVNHLISNALLQAEDWNIFIVDWQDKANSLYSIALGSVPRVGEITAKFISILMNITGITLDNINLSGHSLGAHVCGRIGSLFNGEIETIIGMDPALPFVNQNDINKRLDPTDAKYVQVIHTNGGLLGFLKPIGHADFYPNGGMNQKGCGLDAFGKCAHSRSYMYFAESINNNNFRARYCDSNSDWKNGLCADNPAVYMGGNNLYRICGTFYLDTLGSKPYSLG